MAASQYTIKNGSPTPFGVSKKGSGINFSLFSQNAKAATLCLFNHSDTSSFLEIPLRVPANKTGYIWHVLVEGLPEQVEYMWKLDGPFNQQQGQFYKAGQPLSDPYAKAIGSSTQWNEWQKKNPFRGKVIAEHNFDWGDDLSPGLALKDLIIYEMHVRGFTQDPSSKVKHPGTFLGVIEKIPYLKELGVNAVELLPIFEFNECENERINPKTKERLTNYWGYSTINFFSPMNRFVSSPQWDAALTEFKTMVKELHKNGIEVILDVVYNHTAEGNEKGPYYSFKGIDNKIYYMFDRGHYLDFTGCGNTFNCNQPIAMRLILDSLRYWVSEMHVDGFRFDLASVLTRNEHGVPLPGPPLVKMINADPILASTKMIAEAWDAAGLYQVGSFPGEGKWSEWNGKYRDIVRRFIKGTAGQSGAFATAICGSQDLYGHDRNPCDSINFVTAHDGFTLHDLVSYQQKHNLNNGENNRDGMNDNDSWNCGAEGTTSDPTILALRLRQMKNFHLVLMTSIGTPMILMGDEYGHTRNGNNNSYCQDNELNWFLWNELASSKDFFRFYKLLIHCRKNHTIFKRCNFLKSDEVDWHGEEPFKPNWQFNNHLVAYTLKEGDLEYVYIAYNACFKETTIHLPLPPKGKQWKKIVDTFQPSPNDIVEDLNKAPILGEKFVLKPYSAMMAKAM